MKKVKLWKLITSINLGPPHMAQLTHIFTHKQAKKLYAHIYITHTHKYIKIGKK